MWDSTSVTNSCASAVKGVAGHFMLEYRYAGPIHAVSRGSGCSLPYTLMLFCCHGIRCSHSSVSIEANAPRITQQVLGPSSKMISRMLMALNASNRCHGTPNPPHIGEVDEQQDHAFPAVD